jgi:hypothetical protein
VFNDAIALLAVNVFNDANELLDVKLFNELNILTTCDEPEITPFVAFIAPLNDVAVDEPIVVIEPLI